jgi:hypothetical protein
VLQDALKSSVFVRDLHAYIRTYGINQRDPADNLVVFDEAQRAWDRDYMHAQRGVARSEPELLLDAGARMDGWVSLIGLVGDGQEIHSGEEGGLAQWAEAAKSSGVAWEVHCPPRLEPVFAELRPSVHPELDLTVSLRYREAEHLHSWVHTLVRGEIGQASRLADRMRDLRFPIYLSQSLDEIRDYLAVRYAGETDARYGLVSSSHAKALPSLGVDNSFVATSRMECGEMVQRPCRRPSSVCSSHEDGD